MPSMVPRKYTRGKAGVGLDKGVPERANRGRGKSAAKGGSAIDKAAGAVVKKLDVIANPPKGRKKPPAEVVVPSSNVPGAVVSAAEGGSAIDKAAGAVVKKSDVIANPPKGRKKPPVEVVVPSSNGPSAVVVGKKSDVPPDPTARTNPAAEGVVLGKVPGAVVGAKSDADPKGQKQPVVDGIVMCGG